MLMEKKLEDAMKAYTKGKKVVVLQELEDGSLYSCPMEDYIDDKTHFLVDVLACDNPDWNKAMHEMVVGSSQETEEAKLEETDSEEPQNLSGGATTSIPEPLRENKYEVVKDCTVYEKGDPKKNVKPITL